MEVSELRASALADTNQQFGAWRFTKGHGKSLGCPGTVPGSEERREVGWEFLSGARPP